MGIDTNLPSQLNAIAKPPSYTEDEIQAAVAEENALEGTRDEFAEAATDEEFRLQ